MLRLRGCGLSTRYQNKCWPQLGGQSPYDQPDRMPTARYPPVLIAAISHAGLYDQGSGLRLPHTLARMSFGTAMHSRQYLLRYGKVYLHRPGQVLVEPPDKLLSEDRR